MIPVETTQENEQRLREASLDASLRLTVAMLSSQKVTLKGDVSEVSVTRVAGVFYAYLKGEEAK